jgi:hypothetical protein
MDTRDKIAAASRRPLLRRNASWNLASTVIVAFTTLFAGAAAIAEPDFPDAGHGPVTIVSDSEFHEMTKSGQLHLTGPAQVRNEFRQFDLKERIDKKIVDEFIRRHPDLSGLAQLVAATPTGPGVSRMVNGDYQWAFGGFGAYFRGYLTPN